MPRVYRFLVLPLVAVFAACGDYRTPTAPLRPGELPPSLGISDGIHGLGNQGFFFLPPLVSNPSSSSEFGDSPFKANANPHVEICLLDKLTVGELSFASCTSDALAAAFDASQISVSTTDQQYHVNWNTDDSNLMPGRFYRITVFVGTQQLGYADVLPVTSARDLKNPKTGEVIPLLDGRTLPIKFRIEQEAVCEFQDDCAKKRISVATGGTVSTPSGDATLVFPAGFVDGAQTVEITVQKISLAEGESCHAASGQEKTLAFVFGTCYEATASPAIFDIDPTGFNTPVTWVQCFADRADKIPPGLTDFVQIFKSDPPDRGGLQALQELPTPAGFCDLRIGEARSPGAGAFAMLRWRLDRAAHQLAALVRPTTAYAIDLGLSGQIGIGGGLSRFQRGVRAEAARDGNQTRTGTVGGTIDLAVIVSADEHHHHEGGSETHENSPLPGVAVLFELLRDGAVIASQSVDSELEEFGEGSAALARVAFPLAAAGDYTARATALASGSPITWSITVAEATGSITGFVSTNESGIDGAQVRLVGITDPSFQRSTTTDDGEYSFVNLPDGRYSVAAAAIGFTMGRQEVVLDGEGRDQTVNITLTPTGGIAGVVTNALTGATVPGASVRIVGTETGAVTNADGRFSFTNLRAGSYTLRTTMVNFQPKDTDVTVGADQAGVTIALQPTPADLAVTTFSVTPAEPTTADRITYTVVITNVGGTASPASEATLTEGFSATRNGEPVAGGSVNPGLTIDPIAPGSSATLTLSAADFGGGPMSRSATFSITTTDANGINNAKGASFTVSQAIGVLLRVLPEVLAGN